MRGFERFEWLYPYALQALRIAAVFVFALVAVRLVNGFLGRLRGRFLAAMLRESGVRAPSREIEKRAATISLVLRKTITAVIWIGAILMALNEARFNITPLLAGAGVAGLALGMGAQTLVGDLIAGIFILIENYIRVDDIVIINGTVGQVQEVNLRTTVLRSEDGTLHVFRNASIRTLSNMTWEHAYAVVDVRTGHQEDPDRVAVVLKEIGDAMAAEEPYASAVLEPLEVLGVERLTDFGFVTQARVKTLPTLQFAVSRELNRRIKKRFAELGIELK